MGLTYVSVTAGVIYFLCSRDPKTGCPGSFRTSPARRSEKGRDVYSLTVSHFRKSAKVIKVGSHRNGHLLIYKSDYKLRYDKYDNINVSDNHVSYSESPRV